ncbi:hypothetical protein F66182_10285 [Fusarium sp. NRRL 66182]|nr:hypothetical protein F66182_10285 [Fusarium sp. NRRL 66182]
MAGPRYHHIKEQDSQASSTEIEQVQSLVVQPQPLTAPESATSPTKGPIWIAKVNLRFLSNSINIILFIIVFALFVGPSDDQTPMLIFGPLVAVAFAWNIVDLLHLLAQRRCIFQPSTLLYTDLLLSSAFVVSSCLGGYFGTAHHPASGSAPSKDEPHLAGRALGCFGIAEVVVHVLLAAIAYFERKTQAGEPLGLTRITSRADDTRRNKDDKFRDE